MKLELICELPERYQLVSIQRRRVPPWGANNFTWCVCVTPDLGADFFRSEHTAIGEDDDLSMALQKAVEHSERKQADPVRFATTYSAKKELMKPKLEGLDLDL